MASARQFELLSSHRRGASPTNYVPTKRDQRLLDGTGNDFDGRSAARDQYPLHELRVLDRRLTGVQQEPNLAVAYDDIRQTIETNFRRWNWFQQRSPRTSSHHHTRLNNHVAQLAMQSQSLSECHKYKHGVRQIFAVPSEEQGSVIPYGSNTHASALNAPAKQISASKISKPINPGISFPLRCLSPALPLRVAQQVGHGTQYVSVAHPSLRGASQQFQSSIL